MLLRRLGDRWDLGSWIDRWAAVPDPTIFGRWLRRAGSTLLPLLNALLWYLLRARWAEEGVPRQLTVALDSMVYVRYGQKQAGAERAYNRGAAVEGRIKELGQLSVGGTTVDDLDGNALHRTRGTVAYQLLHTIRSQALSGSWWRPPQIGSGPGSSGYPAASPATLGRPTCSSDATSRSGAGYLWPYDGSPPCGPRPGRPRPADGLDLCLPPGAKCVRGPDRTAHDTAQLPEIDRPERQNVPIPVPCDRELTEKPKTAADPWAAQDQL